MACQSFEWNTGGARLLDSRELLWSVPPISLATMTCNTAWEVKVLRLVAEGAQTRKFARQLHLTEPTVRFHVHNLFTKLGVNRRTQLASVAQQRGLL
jgi:LuxR family maltose regulon positive regulatory protein